MSSNRFYFRPNSNSDVDQEVLQHFGDQNGASWQHFYRSTKQDEEEISRTFSTTQNKVKLTLLIFQKSLGN
jgi:hypothetical protein